MTVGVNVRGHDNAHTTYANYECLIREYVRECGRVHARVRECVRECVHARVRDRG